MLKKSTCSILHTVIVRLFSAWISSAYAAGQPFGSFEVSDWALGGQTWGSMISSIIETLVASIVYVSGAVFILGALFFALAGAKEDWKAWGKSMMINALIALAVVMGSLSILRATSFFIWG